MARTVSDSDSLRRQNRSLLLGALRDRGPQSRTVLATTTGLSHASVTAIMQDLLAQKIVTELASPSSNDSRSRGRPSTLVGFKRDAAYGALFEIDVNRCRLSLVDYSGVLVDRIETELGPASFKDAPPVQFIAERLAALEKRNPSAYAALRRIAISVQGILVRDGTGLKWSPIKHFTGIAITTELTGLTGLPVSLHKRGSLLAEGTRWVDDRLQDASIATVFIGSTVAMGLSLDPHAAGQSINGATEFGHMNHSPGGALCRCGARGCIEAYAADYGVLRSAFSVPDTTPPAHSVPTAQYEALISRAQHGDREATHAFAVAGRAIGYGLARMLSMHDPSHIVIVGPGARALPLMQHEIENALQSALVCRINGIPELIVHMDEKEPIFRGLQMKTLRDIDHLDFAPLSTSDKIVGK